MKTRIYLLTTALVAGTIAIAQAQSPSSQSPNQRQTTSPPAKHMDDSAGSTRSTATKGAAGRSDSDRSSESNRSDTGKFDSDRSDAGKATTGTSTSGAANDQSRDQPRSSDSAQSPTRDRSSNDSAQSRDRTNNRDADRSDSKHDTRDSADRDNRNGTNTSRSDSDRPATNQQTDRGRNGDTDRTRTSTNVDVNINSQQRTRINRSIARLDVKPITNVNFSVSVGTVVPRHVHLRTIPADIVEIVPQYRGYNFFVVRDEIVIVEPSSSRIVTVIPRSGGGSAEAAPRQRTKFTEKDRAAVRKYSRRSEPRTTGSAVRSSRISVGERVPASVELQSFPEEVYVDAPELREYRYLRQENRTYVIEPHERTIIEEID
ncbi:DUF1236 domain-containing protein [Bradyrhizobium sp. SYSU BS000235]|uniref:DUF1236 domain-containing protein n=1 Tax=Bradyrhizobium sp. SYSU BS000235 TaxID=3411332 RepID=UPI003C78FC16